MYVRDPAENLVEIDWPDAGSLDPSIRAGLTSLSAAIPQSASSLGATPDRERVNAASPHVPTPPWVDGS